MVKQKRTKLRKIALAGNRNRASRVAGENSATEPPVLSVHVQNNNRTKKSVNSIKFCLLVPFVKGLPDQSPNAVYSFQLREYLLYHSPSLILKL